MCKRGGAIMKKEKNGGLKVGLNEHEKRTKKNHSKHKNKSAFMKVKVLNNVPIGMKYLIIFLFSVILFFAATLIVYMQLSVAKKDVDLIITHSEIANSMTGMALIVEQQHSAINSYAMTGNERHIESYDRMYEHLQQVLEKLDGAFVNDDEHKYEAIMMNVESIHDLVHNKLIPQKQNNEGVVSTQIEIDTLKDALMNLSNDLIKSFSVLQEQSVASVNDSMNRSIVFLIVINIISIVIGFITLLIIGRFISNNLKRVVQATTKIAQGDLRLDPLPYKGKDEIGMLSEAVNTLNKNIKDIIEKVQNASQAVTSSSELLMLASREVKEGSEQMVITMDELASGAETQANTASDLSEQMGNFVDSVHQSQQDGSAVVKSSEQVLKLTNEGSKLMTESVNQIMAIDDKVSESVEKVIGLDEKSEQISHLVDVVKNIADQTNLLALNAAIEAARAGEHGRGFAVVAEEVRKLAEEVAHSVTEITNIVTTIQTETHEVVTTLNDVYKQVKEGSEQIEETGSSFKTIEYFIESMVSSIQTVANRLAQISESSEHMNSLITDIAAVSEQAAAGVEQSSASTQQTSSAMDQISVNAEQLAKLAEQLNREVNVFKI